MGEDGVKGKWMKDAGGGGDENQKLVTELQSCRERK